MSQTHLVRLIIIVIAALLSLIAVCCCFRGSANLSPTGLQVSVETESDPAGSDEPTDQVTDPSPTD